MKPISINRYDQAVPESSDQVTIVQPPGEVTDVLEFDDALK